jgi:3-hydroxyacyl-CoA dehydrogenase
MRFGWFGYSGPCGRNTYELVKNDEQKDTFKLPAFINTMIEKKLLGNKTGAGFYSRNG